MNQHVADFKPLNMDVQAVPEEKKTANQLSEVQNYHQL